MDEREWSLRELQQLVNERRDEMPEAIRWFWTKGPYDARHGSFISTAASEWRSRADVRAVLEDLRPPSPELNEAGLYPGLMDWLALNDALGLREDVRAWFDDRLRRGDLKIPALHRLEAALLERARLSDWLVLEDPVTAVRWRVDYQLPDLGDVPSEVTDIVRDENDAEMETEIAWWRTVAAHAKREHLGEIDAAIAKYARKEQVNSWLARPFSELVEARLAQTDLLRL